MSVSFSMIQCIQRCVNDDAALVRRGRYVTLVFLLGVGERDYLLSIDRGRVIAIVPRTLATQTGRFTVRADAPTWIEHWKPLPARNYHDLFSMLPAKLAVIDGDLLPLMQNLQYFKDVLASVRSGRAADAAV